MRVVVNALKSSAQLDSCLLVCYCYCASSALCVFRDLSLREQNKKKTNVLYILLNVNIVIVVVANVVLPLHHSTTHKTAKQTIHILPHPHTSRYVAQAQNSGIC